MTSLSQQPSVLILISVFSGLFLISIMGIFTSNKFKPAGKHCYIAGASQGLGLGLAIVLARMGAHVTIVGRDRKKLEIAKKQVEDARQSPSQIIQALSYDLSKASNTSAALDECCIPFEGKPPQYVFCTAGISIPKFLIDLSEEEIKKQIETDIYPTIYTTQEATKRMVQHGVKGTIAVTSSVLGLQTFAGYSVYSFCKYGVRGFVDALRNEYKMYGISIHAYFPAGIKSPGLEVENSVKTELTKRIEGPDPGQTPEDSARNLIRGLEKGYTYITSEIVGDLFRNSQGGLTPGNNVFMDAILSFAGLIAFPIWRLIIDMDAKSEGKKLKVLK